MLERGKINNTLFFRPYFDICTNRFLSWLNNKMTFFGKI